MRATKNQFKNLHQSLGVTSGMMEDLPMVAGTCGTFSDGESSMFGKKS